MTKTALLSLALVSSLGMFCVPSHAAPVNLNTWSQESYPAVAGFSPGVWTVGGGGSNVTQSVNGQPTLYVGDFNAYGTKITGKIRAGNDGDDDYIGFALGFVAGDTTNPLANYLLVDWKQGSQSFDFGAPSTSPGGTRIITTLIGALMVRLGYADGLICGTFGNFARHLHFVRNVLGLKEGLRNFYAMNLLNLPGRTLMLCDTYVNYDPTAEQVVEMTVLAAEEARRFGIEPRIALLSHSNFGSDNTVTSDKMRRALEILHADYPELEVEGEMHGDAALDIDIRTRIFPNSRLRDEANLLIFPTLDAANISYNLLKTAAGEGMTIGPILLGAKQPVHILTPTATVRRIVNMTALTVVEASHIR